MKRIIKINISKEKEKKNLRKLKCVLLQTTKILISDFGIRIYLVRVLKDNVVWK